MSDMEKESQGQSCPDTKCSDGLPTAFTLFFCVGFFLIIVLVIVFGIWFLVRKKKRENEQREPEKNPFISQDTQEVDRLRKIVREKDQKIKELQNSQLTHSRQKQEHGRDSVYLQENLDLKKIIETQGININDLKHRIDIITTEQIQCKQALESENQYLRNSMQKQGRNNNEHTRQEIYDRDQQLLELENVIDQMKSDQSRLEKEKQSDIRIINDLKHQVEMRDRDIQMLNIAIETNKRNGEKILSLERDLKAATGETERLNILLSKNSQHVNNVDDEIAKKDSIIQSLKNEVGKNNYELGLLNTNIAALKKENDERQERISLLTTQLKKKTEDLNHLEREHRALQERYNQILQKGSRQRRK